MIVQSAANCKNQLVDPPQAHFSFDKSLEKYGKYIYNGEKLSTEDAAPPKKPFGEQTVNNMKQFTIVSDTPDKLLQLLDSLRDKPYYKNASDRLLLVMSGVSGADAARGALERLSVKAQDVKLAGLTTANPGGTVWTLLLFERSRVELCHYDCGAADVGEAAKQLRRTLRYQKHAAGVVLFSSLPGGDTERFLSLLGKNGRLTAPVFGALADSEASPSVLGGFGADERGIVALVLCGAMLQLHYHYDVGWRPIGKEFRVSETDGACLVSQLDGEPAVRVYEKYLGIAADRGFVDNARGFPLALERGGRRVLRCPTGFDRSGRLHFNAPLAEGDAVRLCCASPRRLLEESQLYADALRAFEPQALLLTVCDSRTRFLGEPPGSDVCGCTVFLPQCARSEVCAGILLDQHGGGIVNSAVVSLAMREGDAHKARPVVLPEPRAQSAFPLDERLAHYLAQTTVELDEAKAALASLRGTAGGQADDQKSEVQ